MRILLYSLPLLVLVYHEFKPHFKPDVKPSIQEHIPQKREIKHLPKKRMFTSISPLQKKMDGELLSLIKRFEGFSNSVYKCQAGVDTIGYGFTDPKIVKKGFLTEEEASAILEEEINKHYSYVDSLVKVELTEQQKIALTSFSFNCGKGNLKNITTRINKGKIQEAANAILLYVKANGKVSKGLQKRRNIEYQLFTSA